MPDLSLLLRHPMEEPLTTTGCSNSPMCSSRTSTFSTFMRCLDELRLRPFGQRVLGTHFVPPFASFGC
jgi:hypothetical protein